ncbi:HugZ family pyridoxamine 5'-phosphate oxidase [Phaeobacter marinintestinus]|uniref:HugZ family pyridoxamine 5'-phosphate oxidase n=1 Tax=Falsiphaeobacter marinintestinus TaxID=1492905 RepID=UPI0011B44201|nr:pyridoxamine 5'-phosphate oxidase family protein [Phaeobacter marinintestinus]
MTDPIRPTDDDARQMARDLLAQARHAALAVVLPDGSPMVTRVAFGLGPDGHPLTLVSDLSAHTTALKANPNGALLIGEPGERGDPLTHPRLTLMAQARFLRKGDTGYDKTAAHYLRDHPKSKLYIGFADFSFAVFSTRQGHLNGGFGKAFVLTPKDMALPT